MAATTTDGKSSSGASSPLGFYVFSSDFCYAVRTFFHSFQVLQAVSESIKVCAVLHDQKLQYGLMGMCG